MNTWKNWNNCTIFWWVVALAAAISTYSASVGATSVIVALLMGVAVGIFVGFAMTRFFCLGSGSGVNDGVSYTRPAIGSDTPSIATAAARAALRKGPDYAPPSANVFGATGAAKPAKASATAKPAVSEPAAQTPVAPAPAPEATPDYDKDGVHEGTDEGTRPATLDAPRGGVADNLKEIKGIGPKLEKLCHSMGFYHFDQIANWTPDEVAWVDANLQGFKGRVSRDNWIAQARILAAGGETEFSKRVEDGDVY